MLKTLNITDALAHVRSEFDFSVDKFPLFGPENMPTDQYGLFHSKDGYLNGVKSISPRYVPHTTDDVVALVEAATEAFDGELDISCHFNKGHYVQLLPSIQRRKELFNVTTNDNVFPRFMISGGFDGKGFRASIGYFRDLCRNMAMMRSAKDKNGKKQKFAITIQHTSGLRSEMNELIDTFSQLKESWTSLTDLITGMQQKTVNMREFLKTIYGEPHDDSTQREIVIHTKRTTKIVDRLWNELWKTNQVPDPTEFDYQNLYHGTVQLAEPAAINLNVSAWMAYNAVQGFEQHDSTRRGVQLHGSAEKFERMLRAENASVLTAEKLALAA